MEPFVEHAEMLPMPMMDTAGVCIERLDCLGNQLKQMSSQVEAAVVDVCDSFYSIADKARAETERLVHLLNPPQKQEGAKSFEQLLQSCGQMLVQLLETQSNSNAMIADAVGRLRKIDDSASKIEQALTQLEQISQGNRLLALNARIEAANSPQQERGFNAVAVELAAQTERTKTLTSDVGDLSCLLRKLAESAVVDLKRMQADTLASSQNMRVEVDRTLSDLSVAYQTMREVVSQSQQTSTLLVKDIYEAIRGMQFQDRVSQQIAHVVHDLQVVRKHIAAEDLGSNTFPNETLEFSAFAMHEERSVHGYTGDESPEGDVELF